MITHLSPVVVFVKDFERSLAFYRDKVGLTLAYPPVYGPGGGWAEFRLKGAGFCLHSGGKGSNRKSPVDVHFRVKGIRAAVRQMKAKGVRFAKPVKKMPWGWETTLVDPDGNTFELLEPTPWRKG